MLTERRHHVRHRIRRPAYASMAEGSRGLVLDAHERGLALRSDVPIPVCTKVQVKLGLMERGRCIETAARVAWSDGADRIGIEFLDLSLESRRELQEWLRLSSQPEVNRAEIAFAVEDASFAETSSDARFASAAERAMLLTLAHGAAIALSDGNSFVCRAEAGELTPPVGTRIDPQSGLTGACLRLGRVMRCDSADSHSQVDSESCRNLGISSLIAAPIVRGGCVVGLIEVFSRRPHAFDDSDCNALERLADAVADSMSASGWLGQERENPLPHTAVSNGVAAPSTISTDESSPVTGLLVPGGYKFSFTEKLMLHKRAGQWSVAGIALAVGLWLAFGTPSLWRTNAAPVSDGNPRVAEQDQTTPNANRPRAISAVPVPRTQDWVEKVRERAEGGDPTAELKLGAAYAAGQDNVHNYTEAVKWLTRSADQGNVTAAAVLGAFYWAGRGVTPGYVNAYVWSAIAQAQGDEASSYRLTILQSRMSPAELAEARRDAKVWLRTHSKRVAIKPTPSFR